MARIKIEDIIDHLDYEIRHALRDAVQDILPDVKFDEYELFRKFKHKVSYKCDTWESVPDSYIEKD